MDYALFGLRVASDLTLPELAPWGGDERRPDVEIRLGKVPDRLGDLVHSEPLFQLSADGTCRFALKSVGAYMVEGGRRITIEPYTDIDAPDLRAFLLGSNLAFLCHQRGLLPLHAACVKIGGKAIILAGDSGVGKSTLAAAFLRRGFPILADDITVVDTAAPGGAVVLPSFPRVKLWRDALDGLGLPAEGLDLCRRGIEKYQFPVDHLFQTSPLDLEAVYHLRFVQQPRCAGITPLRGGAAISAFMADVYRERTACRMGKRPHLMRAAMQLASVPRFRLTRGPGLGLIDALVSDISDRHLTAP